MWWAGAWYFIFGSYSVIQAAKLQWSPSYHLKAVLNIPLAQVSDPYEVWYDSKSGNARIDFYNGVSKLYKVKRNDGSYATYKLHPETNEEYANKQRCHVAPVSTETALYEDNSYLPDKDFKFICNEMINGKPVDKYEYSQEMGEDIKINYTVWVDSQRKLEGKYHVPVKYDWSMVVGGKVLDYFTHTYELFSTVTPDPSVLQFPLDPKDCESFDWSDDLEPEDPLRELVEPQTEHRRVGRAFDSFKSKHDKQYSTTSEHHERFSNFKNNLRYINSVNRRQKSYVLGVNHFADLSHHEMHILKGTRPPKKVANRNFNEENDEDDENEQVNLRFKNFDWRNYGAVSPIKYQTNLCGSCYAFTAATAIESAAFISKGCQGKLEEVSEQAFLDCSWGYGNMGCNGGEPENCITWSTITGGAVLREDYPYKALEGNCYSNGTRRIPVDASSSVPTNKNRIKEWIVKNGPLTSGMDASPKSVLFYSHGIYDDKDCSSDSLDRNHGIAIIGYGVEGDKEYWIIKNSIGPNWGEGGYMNIAIKDNICGVKHNTIGVKYNKNRVEECFKE